VRVQAPTANAAALRRVGFVRVLAGGGVRVKGLQVRLRHDGRLVAQGARAAAFGGSARVKLGFRAKVRPGSVSLTVSGRQTGCSSSLHDQSTLTLDGRNLEVDVTATDHDVVDRTLGVTLRAAGRQAISDLRARLLDPNGDVIAESTRKAPLRSSARLNFALSRSETGRHVLLVTAGVKGQKGRSSYAEPIDFATASPQDADPVAPGGSAAAPSGAVVAQSTVSWSGGAWPGHDSAGMTAPGIGDGELVCRPDTQWLRFYPTVRTRDVSMMLWTFHDWGAGNEYAIREADMTQYTGPDFDEGFNKFQPAEKVGHGTFVGLVGDGLPTAGTFGAGRPPTEIRLSYDWDFTDPATAHCNVTATMTSQGSTTTGTIARGFSLAYNGAAGVPADTTTATAVPGLGTVALRCDPGAGGDRALIVDPDAPLAGLTLTTYQGSDRSDRAVGDTPYELPLPNNGMIEARASDGSALRLIVSSRWKLDDPDPAQDFCRLSGLAVVG
jgi:hypothetical protein